MWKKSLRRRFTLTLILPVLAVLALASISGYYAARHEVDEIYDAQLANLARTLMALMEHEASEGDTTAEAVEARFREVTHEYEKYTAIRIWHGDKLFFYTSSAKDFGPQHVIAGFSNKDIHGENWRFFVLPDADLGFTVEVAEDYFVRQDLISKIVLTMFVPFLIFLFMLPGLLWIGLKRGLVPLLHISQYVERRSPEDLSPIALDKTPAEIWPLARSINDLMKRVSHALEVERRFADLAAHELRTPLAIIKTQVQNVIHATSESERQELLQDLSGGVQRASDMVVQLLALARLGKENIERSEIKLNEVVRDIAQELLPLALHKHIQVDYIEHTQATLMANAEILAVAIRNLLDNAIKYTPEKGRIEIHVDVRAGTTLLSISDTGPGIPSDKLSMVTERFYRVAGNQQPGSGLGLAIVTRAAEAMGADFTLMNQSAGGLCATLTWPA